MMRACCAATTPRLGELMGSASQQELEIRQDAMTPAEAAHNTNLYVFLSLLTDAKALDIVQNSLVNNAMEVWPRMVKRRETKVPSRHRGVLQAILFPKWDTPGAHARQLLKAWESQMQEYEQQSRDEISNTTMLVVVLYHLPDASYRGHPLLNSRTCNEYDLVAAEIRTAAMVRTTCTGLTPMDLGILAKEAVCHCVWERRILRNRLLVSS